MSQWQKVFEDNAPYRAEMVKDILSDRGMSAVVINKKDSAYQFGHFEVQVEPDNVIPALRVIKEELKFE